MSNFKLLAVVSFFLGIAAVQSFHAAVRSDSGYYCIIMDGNMTGSVNYPAKDNTTKSFSFTVTEVLNAGGSCFYVYKMNTTAQPLKFSFKVDDKDVNPVWDMQILFVSDHDGKGFKVENITLYANFPPALNASVEDETYTLVNKGDDWEVAGDTNGYTCSASKFTLDHDSTLEFDNVRVLAFAHLPNATFPAGQIFEQCTADARTSELVPIIVGACLAGLVIIVLTAYLIGRARAKRQGYASV
ncbi:hypothetical protein M3Y99_01474800 [Aphelenchoides fujianensis]|nr:hypothetical protein M3Y99_01474800 [Aphelenchoides fujianensis]